MRKFFRILVLGLGVMVFSGCGGSTSASNDSTDAYNAWLNAGGSGSYEEYISSLSNSFNQQLATDGHIDTTTTGTAEDTVSLSSLYFGYQIKGSNAEYDITLEYCNDDFEYYHDNTLFDRGTFTVSAFQNILNMEGASTNSYAINTGTDSSSTAFNISVDDDVNMANGDYFRVTDIIKIHC